MTANTGTEAKAILLAEGCTDLKLMEDEFHEVALAGFPKRFNEFGEEIKARSESVEAFGGQPQKTLLQVLNNSIRQDWKLYLVLIALLVLEIYRRDTTRISSISRLAWWRGPRLSNLAWCCLEYIWQN